MPWSALQHSVRRLSAPLRRLIAAYALLVALLTIFRLLQVNGVRLIDLANTFAPYWYMPLGLTFPISIIVTRQADTPQRADGDHLKKAKRHDIGDESGRTHHSSRWSVTLQIVLIAIGLYWFALPTRYKPVDPPKGETFTVVTYNVQGGNKELNRATDWLLAKAADVIVLQETAEGYDHRLERLYHVYAHEDHIEGSVRIFSRYAILEREILTIEEEPGRQALRLLLDQDGRELAVYAVHFVLPQSHNKLYASAPKVGIDFVLRYDERRRNAQIRRLLEILQEEERPFLLAGDFNMSDASLIYSDLAAQLHDAWRGAGTGAGRTWPVAEVIGLPRVIHPLLRIDYIWHSGELRTAAAEVGEAIGSDHLPVIAAFEWR